MGIGGTWHSRFSLRYPLVLAAEDRRPAIHDAILCIMRDSIERVSERNGCEIPARNHGRDRLPLLFSAPPIRSVL